MTEKKLKEANKLKDKISRIEYALKKNIKGFYHDTDYIPLDSETLDCIRTVLENRLWALKKEFEEL